MWQKEQCDETKKNYKQGRIDLMLQKVKELSKRKKRPTNAINDRAGNKLTVSRQK